MCFARTAYCWALPSFAVCFARPSRTASAVESENNLRRKATWLPRYSMREWVQSGFLAHWMSGARFCLAGAGVPPSTTTSGFALARLFRGGMLVVGDLIYFSHVRN